VTSKEFFESAGWFVSLIGGRVLLQPPQQKLLNAEAICRAKVGLPATEITFVPTHNEHGEQTAPAVCR
jgi:hypothetical protein